MPPRKRKTTPINDPTPYAKKKRKKEKKPSTSVQRGIESFFVSPKQKQNGFDTPAKEAAVEGGGKTAQEVILLSDSDDDSEPEPPEAGPSKQTGTVTVGDEDDEAMAKRLAMEYGIDIEELKRKERQDEERLQTLREEETKCEEVNSDGPGRRNGTSVSTTKPTKATPKVLPQTTPAKTAAKKPDTVLEPVSAPDSYPLDTDIFTFDPSQIDTRSWPRRSSTGTPYGSPVKGKAKAVEGQATGGTGVLVPYGFLTAGFVLITSTRSRLYITTVMTNLLRTIIHHDPLSLLPSIYLITNHIAPSYEGVELGVGSQVLSKSIKATTSVTPKELRTLWHRFGDPGDVAFAARSSVRTLFPTPPLTVRSFYDALVKLSQLKGQGTVQVKADIVQKLLVAAKGEEVRYLMRTVCRNLRIGAVRLTVTAALARAFCLTRPLHSDSDVEGTDAGEVKFWIPESDRKGIVAVSQKKGKAKTEETNDPRRVKVMGVLGKAERLVREVYVKHPNYNDIIPALLGGGLEGLRERVPLAVGTPLSPMLGQITRDLSDVAGRLGSSRPFVAEWKYDGQRVQIHARMRAEGEAIPKDYKDEGRGGKWVGEGRKVFVRLFSRHLEDMTDKYPDVLALVPLMIRHAREGETPSWPPSHVESFVADAEVCAIDPTSGHLQTFQTLANRARKDVKLGDVKVRVGIFAFDLMYLNGRSLLTEPFRTRRTLLKSLLPPLAPPDPSIARFDHVASLESTVAELDEVKDFMHRAIENKCEGIMIKVLDHEEGVDAAKVIEIEDDDEAEEGEGDEGEGEEKGSEGGGEEEEGKSKPKGRRKALLSSYEPDKRADSWLKVKKDYGDLGDSLDLVPIGAWHGQGRKAGWWSPILLALYNPDSGGFQSVCKIISGMSDQFYKDLNVRYEKGTDRCSESELAYVEPGGHIPDVWFLPSEVWEIRGADITLSPVYKAALGWVDENRGLSFRFPRFIKIRDDKSIEDALHPDEFAEFYRRQESGPDKSKVPPAIADVELNPETAGAGGFEDLVDHGLDIDDDV